MPKKGYKQTKEHISKIMGKNNGSWKAGIKVTDIVKRYKNGESSYAIAKDENCSNMTILRRLKKNNVKIREGKWEKGKNHPNWKDGIKVNNVKVYQARKSKEWKKKNPEKVAHNNFLRGKRLREAEGSFTLGEWELLKKQYGYLCPDCGRKEPFNQHYIWLTRDHIIPLIKGGSNYIENIQPLCFECNSRKNTKVVRVKNINILED